jgi:hypothetical protein
MFLEEIAALNLAKFRKAQTELGNFILLQTIYKILFCRRIS